MRITGKVKKEKSRIGLNEDTNQSQPMSDKDLEMVTGGLLGSYADCLYGLDKQPAGQKDININTNKK